MTVSLDISRQRQLDRALEELCAEFGDEVRDDIEYRVRALVAGLSDSG